MFCHSSWTGHCSRPKKVVYITFLSRPKQKMKTLGVSVPGFYRRARGGADKSVRASKIFGGQSSFAFCHFAHLLPFLIHNTLPMSFLISSIRLGMTMRARSKTKISLPPHLLQVPCSLGSHPSCLMEPSSGTIHSPCPRSRTRIVAFRWCKSKGSRKVQEAKSNVRAIVPFAFVPIWFPLSLLRVACPVRTASSTRSSLGKTEIR